MTLFWFIVIYFFEIGCGIAGNGVLSISGLYFDGASDIYHYCGQFTVVNNTFLTCQLKNAVAGSSYSWIISTNGGNVSINVGYANAPIISNLVGDACVINGGISGASASLSGNDVDKYRRY